MDDKLMAVITAAVHAYIESENSFDERRFGQRLSPWKMAARRETMSKHVLTVRANPSTTRLRRFSLI
ncbi:MAG: OadG family protein [Candidatus Krumholzibacteria bacterium]|nr:OadG family protein [Candidatus Krumholzibacteria bacterium]